MQQLCNVAKCENYKACQYGAPAARTVNVEQPFKLLSVEMPNCAGYTKPNYDEVMSVKVETVSPSLPGGKMVDPRAVAKMRGYTGDVCATCQNLTMVRNGTCLKCDTCGSTTGCS